MGIEHPLLCTDDSCVHLQMLVESEDNNADSRILLGTYKSITITIGVFIIV